MNPSCYVPFNGLTIAPNGDITLCCVASHFKIANIEDIDDLGEFFRSTVYDDLRNMHLNDHAVLHPACGTCIKKQNRFRTEFHTWNNFDINPDLKLKYLEFTTSNICNQYCNMCNSYFSSKWAKYEDNPHPKNTLSAYSIAKIIDVLPEVEHLCIKGGEPFADLNNLPILANVHENMDVTIVSNMRKIPYPFYEELAKIPKDRLKINGSIDAVNDVYQWIRSSPFEETLDTIEELFFETGHKISLCPTVSFQNFFVADKVAEVFHNKPYIWSVYYRNIVTNPEECNPYLIPEKYYNKKLEDYHRINQYDNVEVGDEILKPKFIENNVQRGFDHIEQINKMRGFDILKYINELCDIKDEYNANLSY